MAPPPFGGLTAGNADPGALFPPGGGEAILFDIDTDPDMLNSASECEARRQAGA
jgi:hypothetical protein